MKLLQHCEKAKRRKRGNAYKVIACAWAFSKHARKKFASRWQPVTSAKLSSKTGTLPNAITRKRNRTFILSSRMWLARHLRRKLYVRTPLSQLVARVTPYCKEINRPRCILPFFKNCPEEQA